MTELSDIFYDPCKNCEGDDCLNCEWVFWPFPEFEPEDDMADYHDREAMYADLRRGG